MLALISVWISLLTLLLAIAMVIHRPLFTDVTVPLVVMFGSPGGLCLAGLVLWSLRKEKTGDAAIIAQRTQAKVSIGLAITASAIIYLLVIFADRLPSN